ncbi:GNAT family N-acetyltransferase [Desulfogranum mediterraneum]|uniref:GNAT family N-acetyltransferase n=1 Tax=Desulfogranum mediterraneum TaxID=160661 RepID=UPI000A0643A9|nr:GNAT family N-acetyltransferase [Desulfogranum mediterraneum]
MELPSTADITFRAMRKSDFKFVKNFLSKVETTRYLPLEKPYSESDAKAWFNLRLDHWQKHNFGTFILSGKRPVEPVGYCGLEFVKESSFVDIRYGLIPSVWGKGYAFQAALAVLEYGFNDLELDKICGAVVPENLPSKSILEKLGFRPDITFDVYGDVVMPFSINRGKFLEKFRVS